jgi:hypothetical protein
MGTVIKERGQVGMPESPAVRGAVRHPMTHVAATALGVPALLCTALLLGGCGNGRVQAPNLSATARPSGFLTIRYRTDGVALSVPSNWTVTAENPPMIAVYSSGPATIALWRYRRSTPAITSPKRLRSALAALVRAAKAKDLSMTVQRTGLSSVSGAGAVIIDALERVGGQPRRVRTEHVYVNGGELVLDAYAPPDEFSSVDHYVFSPVRKSLTLLDGGRSADARATSTAPATAPAPASSVATQSTASRTTVSP